MLLYVCVCGVGGSACTVYSCLYLRPMVGKEWRQVVVLLPLSAQTGVETGSGVADTECTDRSVVG